MPASRKRQRFETAPALSGAAIRAALVSRSGADALSAEGASGADTALRLLGRSIVEAIREVPMNAEAARAQLRSARAALLAAVNSRCDELEDSVNASELSKIAALERELCAVDIALEQLRAERDAAAEAATSLDDFELVKRHDDLTARLDAAEAQLLALPTGVIEPPHIGLLADESTFLDGIAIFGRVVAPRAVEAADLTLEGAPLFVRPGGRLQLRLVLQSAQHASQSAEELEVSLGVAAKSTHVKASLEARAQFAAPQPLLSDVTVDIPGRCMTLLLAVSDAAPAGSSVCFGCVTVNGQPVPGTALEIPVRCSMQPPLSLGWIKSRKSPISLCISPTGQLFVAQQGSPEVHVFDSNGASLHGLDVARIGLSRDTAWVAFAKCDPPTLLLGSDSHSISAGRIVAVDPTTSDIRWATSPACLQSCGELIALPDRNVVIASSYSDHNLFAFRLSDGARVGSLVVPELRSRLTVDPATGAIYGSRGRRREIVYFSWSLEAGFKTEGVVVAAGKRDAARPLVVIPPAPGKRLSHLVIGSYMTPELLVFVLPSLALIHTHVLGGMQVNGFAADPWGETLAVSDEAAMAVHVLAWPLAGMPALE